MITYIKLIRKEDKNLRKSYAEMRVSMEFLEAVVEHGGIIIFMTLIFMAGFICKIICGFCYDGAVEKNNHQNFRQCKILKDTIIKYDEKLKDGNKIKNIQMFVRCELHKWKVLGTLVEKLNIYGNAMILCCIFIGGVTDLIILARFENRSISTEVIVQEIAVYTLVPLIFVVCTFIWDLIIMIDYKREYIITEMVNYIENPREYVKLIKEINVEESNTKKEEIEGQNIEKIDIKELNAEKNVVSEIKKDTLIGDEKEKIVNNNAEKSKEMVINQVLDEFLS